ncbi:hypothetical protein BJX76DRAFT_337594 [Aspergillus varians]
MLPTYSVPVADSMHNQMPPASQKPRHVFFASLRMFPQRIRSELQRFSPWNLSWLARNEVSPDRGQAGMTDSGCRKSSSDTSQETQYVRDSSANSTSQLAQSDPDHGNHRRLGNSHTLVANTHLKRPDSEISDKSNSQAGDLVHFISEGIDVIMRFGGDDPEHTIQTAASIDTQLRPINLMRRAVWDRLNGIGRGELMPINERYIEFMGLKSIQVIGVARGVEWYFKNGYKIYTSDFHIIENDHFDVLIGTRTIVEYELLKLGTDLRYHLERHVKRQFGMRIYERGIERRMTAP